jgi:flagellar biosynthesis/type III secretory pathway chaperone
MTAELTVTARSLTALMRAETAVLATGGSRDIGEIAAAKQRLAGAFEQQVATLDRECSGWAAALAPEGAEALAAAMAELQAATAENGALLERHLDLSRDLLGAIAAEAKRLAGTTSETYGASGAVMQSHSPAPFAVNASL